MISELLKTETKTLHDQVETKFLSYKIFTGTFSEDDYRNLLYSNYILHSHFESRVFSLLSPNFSEKLQLRHRAKLKLIKEDLESMVLPVQIPKLTVSIKNEAQAIGVLYVMEGSTLGGNVIAKQLAKLPQFAQVQFNYFGVYKDQTGSRWKEFKTVLDSEFTADYPHVLEGVQKAYLLLLQN
ncbi:biliverdin-producing heme oxygenase [Chryseobacterium sp.]|uniref:biliverdin-producing heme oxygenase n=1 Tax=Chryseobacterium sp. TaxID=1871047 RepID=UPI0011CA9DAD|nr:biliverdin-producing heme oxygenase [Chryseobacterium sp.]TXF75115.1 biliverdin-producing heme oxygenase [Chryseobacterium sp.]